MASKPDIIFREGKPAAVILSIEEYERLLERAEDAHDLKRLREMRKRKLEFTPLSDYRAERKRRRRV